MIGRGLLSWIEIHEGDVEIVFLAIGPICVGLRIDVVKRWLGIT